MINIVGSSEAKSKFSEVIGRVAYGRERIIIQRKGKSMAAVISIEDLEKLEELEEALDTKILKQAMDSPGKMLSVDDIIKNYENTHNIRLNLEHEENI